MAVTPENLVVVGRVLDAWGLAGGIKVARYSPDADALLAAQRWWLSAVTGARQYEVESAQLHGQAVRALLRGVADRDAALALRGATVSVARADFPALEPGEYYWVDLIGLEVVNLAGAVLGRVAELMESGAHPILVVEGTGDAGVQGTKRLIPFVDALIRDVDLRARRVLVNWEQDY